MRVETNAGNTTIVVTSPVVIGIAIFFLATGALDVVLSFTPVFPKEAGTIQTGIIGLAVGIVAGFVPARTVLEIDRAAGSLRRTTRALFKRSEDASTLAGLAAVVLRPDTFYWWVGVRRADGFRFDLFSTMKRTWTFGAAPPADVVADAATLASVLGVPFEAPPVQ